MDIKKLPNVIENIRKNDLLNIIFYNSLFSIGNSPIKIHNNHNIIYPFVNEAIYEYYMKFNKDGEIVPMPWIEGDIVSTIFSLPKTVLDKYGSDNIMTLFYLWQIEDQPDIYIKLFRYSWIFNFVNEKINMPKVFEKKYGCTYTSYEIFCLANYMTYFALQQSNNEEKKVYFNKMLVTIMKICKKVTNSLSITRENYVKESDSVCGNNDLLTFALKISKIYPFIIEGDNIVCYMPHTIIPACSSSLLFRLTYENDELHQVISKEVLEEFCYYLFKTQRYYSDVKREIPFGDNKLSSDVLIVEDNILYCIEIKAFTPNTKTRLLNPKDIKKQIDEVSKDLFQIYKFIFLNYPIDNQFLSQFDLEKRYGLLALREDASFDRNILYSNLFLLIESYRASSLTDEEKIYIRSKIKISSLIELENMVFTNTRLSKIVAHYNIPGHEMDYTAQSAFNKSKSNKVLSDYKKRVSSLAISFIRYLSLIYF